jgi:hypothetical protein
MISFAVSVSPDEPGDTGRVSGVCACPIARPLKQQTNASTMASIEADFIPRTSPPAITHFAEEKFAS